MTSLRHAHEGIVDGACPHAGGIVYRGHFPDDGGALVGRSGLWKRPCRIIE